MVELLIDSVPDSNMKQKLKLISFTLYLLGIGFSKFDLEPHHNREVVDKD